MRTETGRKWPQIFFYWSNYMITFFRHASLKVSMCIDFSKSSTKNPVLSFTIYLIPFPWFLENYFFFFQWGMGRGCLISYGAPDSVLTTVGGSWETRCNAREQTRASCKQCYHLDPCTISLTLELFFLSLKFKVQCHLVIKQSLLTFLKLCDLSHLPASLGGKDFLSPL